MSRRLNTSAMLFIDTLQKILDFGGYHFGGKQFVAQPQECYVHTLHLHRFKYGLVKPVGFANLSFHTVPQNGTLEMAL